MGRSVRRGSAATLRLPVEQRLAPDLTGRVRLSCSPCVHRSFTRILPMRATGKHSVPPSWRTTHGGGAQNETAAPLGTAVSPLVRLTGLLATPSSASWMPRPLSPSSASRPDQAGSSPPSARSGTTLCSRNRRVRATRIPRVAEARSHRSAFARGRPREPSRTGAQTNALLSIGPLVRPSVCTSSVAESRTSQKRRASLLPPSENEVSQSRSEQAAPPAHAPG